MKTADRFRILSKRKSLQAGIVVCFRILVFIDEILVYCTDRNDTMSNCRLNHAHLHDSLFPEFRGKRSCQTWRRCRREKIQ